MLSKIQKHYVMHGLRVDSSKHEGSSQLNRIVIKYGLRGMEGKEYRDLDLFFPFVFGYGDNCTGYEDESPLKRIHVQYTNIKNRPMSDNLSRG